MKKKTLIKILIFLILMFSLFIIFYEGNIESTTQNINVVSKGQDSTTSDLWIVISNDKKLYIEDFSLWALIEVDHNYTMVYDYSIISKKYNLRTIVPGDYTGRF